ncbi:MAG: hypothetical protein ACOCXP_02875 [Candidatus Dojkabacteria bacterium]
MYYKTKELRLDQTRQKDEEYISSLYNEGFLFGRVERGYMYQTRSLRVDVSQFAPNSENRRIIRKHTENDLFSMRNEFLPIEKKNYDYSLHKRGKEFYRTKFPEEKFTAAKIKELLTREHNYNLLFSYLRDSNIVGNAICYSNSTCLHYCYPFYDLELDRSNFGMYMMIQALLWAQMHGTNYVYLGGVTRAQDIYKLQFSGLEWFDGNSWNKDIASLKLILRSEPS